MKNILTISIIILSCISLKAQKNKIYYSLKEALKNPDIVYELNLNYTGLSSISESIGELTNLTTLYLGGNQLSSLPSSIGQLANLTYLDLSNNQFTNLPNSIGQLTNLITLDLMNNQLSSLPESIGHLENLEILWLDNNHLTSLPTSIVKLNMLDYLRLEGNELTKLPKSIGKLTNLRFLHLNYNQLTSLPNSIGRLTNLESLELSSNQLTSLPKSLERLPNLSHLDFLNNQLADLSESFVQDSVYAENYQERSKDFTELNAVSKEEEEKYNVDNLESELIRLNKEYLKKFSSGEKEGLMSVINSITLILNNPKTIICTSTAQLSILNTCEYYLIQGYHVEFQKIVDLIPDDCKSLAKEYLQLSNLIMAGKTDEAKAIVKKVGLGLDVDCLVIDTDCYDQFVKKGFPEFIGMYLSVVALIYKESEEITKAIEYGKTGVSWNRFTRNSLQEFNSLLVLASFYNSSNQMGEVYKLLNPYKDKIDQYKWTSQVKYYSLMSSVALNKGDSEEQLLYQNEVERIKFKHHVILTMADRINNTASWIPLEYVLNTTASDSFKGIIREMEERNEYNSPNYSLAVLYMSMCVERNMSGNNKQYIKDKLEHIEGKQGRLKLIFHLGQLEFNELNFEAVAYLEESLSLSVEVKDKLNQLKTRQMLATLYDILDMNEKAKVHYLNSVILAEGLIPNFYPYLTEKEQYNFNLKWIQEMERSVFSFFARQSKTVQNEMADGLLKFRLQTKGLLLQNSVQSQLAVINSTDESVKELYELMVQKKQTLSMKHHIFTRQEIKKLIDEIEQLDESINNSLSIKKDDAIEIFSIEEIQKALLPNEYAIEMVRTQVGTGKFLSDTINYTFFIIPPEGELEVITLRNSATLEQRDYNFYSKSIRFKVVDNKSYPIYWSFLEKYIPEKSIVYISTDGIYNGISLNSLFDPSSKKYLSEKNTLIQLSSLREILDKDQKDEIIMNKSVFIGRPKFHIVDDSKDENKRGSIISDLPGTQIEIELISNKMREINLSVDVHTGIEANETIAKNVKSPGILHIATHGYFDRKVDSENFFDSPMLSSGLLLAGAGEGVLADGEDGVLTAYEITSIDLSNTSLVVLSACESGVGANRDGQGVYGLTRAFMVAGAEAVVSSLWKVDDTATQKFMDLFYSKWLVNYDLINSLQHARDELRKEYPEPYYWGAFTSIGL